MATTATVSPDNPELEELKSIIKSFVISSEGNATIGRIAREYEEMEGQAIPFHKFGPFRTLSDFMRSNLFRDEFFFGCNKDGIEVLKPKSDEKTAHIQDLVKNQRHDRRKKKKPLRPGVSRAGHRSFAAPAFQFHASGMNRIGFHSNTRNAAAGRSTFQTNRPTGGFSLRPGQTPVRPLAAQQNNMQQRPQFQPQQQQQQPFEWPAPVKPASGPTATPAAAPTLRRPFPQKTSTPNTTAVSQNKDFNFSTWDYEQKPAASAAASGRTVVTNFASQRAAVTAKAAEPQSLIKVCTSPATSFKASVLRPGRGSSPKKIVSDAPPGQLSLSISESPEKADRLQWLRLKCLQTFYFVRKEAATTGISISDFAAKFFQMHKVFLVKECEQRTGSDDAVQFLEQSFASPVPKSPDSGTLSDDSSKTQEMKSEDSSTTGTDSLLLKIVDKKTLMFNRKKFRDLIHSLMEAVISDSLPDLKQGQKKKPLPAEFVPPVLEDQLILELGLKAGKHEAELAAILLQWFFNRFLPSSQSGQSVTVPRTVTSFSVELRVFSQERAKLNFPYSLFPVPSDFDMIRGFDEDELSDPELVSSGDAKSMNWIPVQICSVLRPENIYVTRVKEQDALNLLSDEMAAFYESSEGRGSDYVVPQELLVVGQLVAVPLRARQTTTTRRVFRSEDQDGDLLERRWTRAIIQKPYDWQTRSFAAHLIDMGCGMMFREARFLRRDQFLNPKLGFDRGFAVSVGLLGIVPPIDLYTKQLLSDPESVADLPPEQIPDLLASKSFPKAAVEFIRLQYATKKYLTAAVFASKRKGQQYEALIADVTDDTDDFLTETLCSKGLAQQLFVEDALSLLRAERTLDDVLKKRIMQLLITA